MRFIILSLVVTLSLWNNISYGKDIPTTEEFQSMLMGCAMGANIEVNADILGSIARIYAGDKTQGKASIKSETKFLELIPDTDRLKAYEIYVSCITKILNITPEINTKVSYNDPNKILHVMYEKGVRSKFDGDEPVKRLDTGDVYSFEKLEMEVQFIAECGIIKTKHWRNMTGQWAERLIAYCVKSGTLASLSYYDNSDCSEASKNYNCIKITCK